MDDDDDDDLLETPVEADFDEAMLEDMDGEDDFADFGDGEEDFDEGGDFASLSEFAHILEDSGVDQTEVCFFFFF